MTPYGRIKKLKGFVGKVDYHPPRGYVNWWEVEMGDNTVSRSTMKAIVREELDEAMTAQRENVQKERGE